MMTTREVAAYLRIKERKVYDLVKARRIPSTRVTGKWLFPKRLIDAWIAEDAGGTPAAAHRAQAPPVIAGSHDPLLEWALAESGCGLAMLPGGSLDGLRRLAAGEVAVCGLHLFDAGGGEYNLATVREALSGLDVVVITWAWREQGLVVAPSNPLGLKSVRDLSAKRARVVQRQDEAGSQLLFLHLLGEAGLRASELETLPGPARSETEIALAVLEGKADAGLAVAAAARRLKLDFVPLHQERYDLAMRRRDYFEPPLQRLLTFTRSSAFADHARELGGYDCSRLGHVVYNGP